MTGVSTLAPGSNGGNVSDPSEYVLTSYGYDAAGNRFATISPSLALTVETYDMLGDVIETQTYDSGQLVLGGSDGVWGAMGYDLLACSQSVYQNGQLYQSIQDEVIDGNQTGNSNTTTYASSQDPLNRQNKVTDPTSAYTLTTYDLQGDVLSQQSYSSSGSLFNITENVYDAAGELLRVLKGTTAGNAVPTTLYFYDTNGDGSGSQDEGRLTGTAALNAVVTLPGSVTGSTYTSTNSAIYSDDNTTWSLTTYEYDGFGRKYLTTTAIPNDQDQTGGFDGVLHAITTEQDYDPAGQPTSTESYLADDTSRLLSESTDTYSIEAPYYGIYLSSSTTDAISGGEVVGGLTTNYYYGAYGRLVETLNPDGSFTKTTYSLGGTVLATYDGTYSGEGTESPSSVTSDYVVDQTNYQYDSLSDVVLTTTSERNAGDTTSTGA